jgi:hypothetical protein
MCHFPLDKNTGYPQEVYAVDLLDLGDVSTDLSAIMTPGLVDLLLEADCEESATTDGDYDSVSSPGGSTCSGPIYVRHNGFGPDPPHHRRRPLSDGTPSPGRASPPLIGPPPHVMHKELLSRHRPPLPMPDTSTVSDKMAAGSSGSEAKKKKKKGLLCPDYSATAGKKEIRGVQVASVGTAKAGVTALAGPAASGLLASSRPKHKKGDSWKTENVFFLLCRYSGKGVERGQSSASSASLGGGGGKGGGNNRFLAAITTDSHVTAFGKQTLWYRTLSTRPFVLRPAVPNLPYTDLQYRTSNANHKFLWDHRHIVNWSYKRISNCVQICSGTIAVI